MIYMFILSLIELSEATKGRGNKAISIFLLAVGIIEGTGQVIIPLIENRKAGVENIIAGIIYLVYSICIYKTIKAKMDFFNKNQ